MKNLVILIAISYCFTWFRTPNIIGDLFLPIQRVLGWIGFLYALFFLYEKRKISISPVNKIFWYTIAFILLFLSIHPLISMVSSNEYIFFYYIKDFSKHLAIFSTTFIVYYALRKKILTTHELESYIILSGKISIYISLLCLLIYLLGIRGDYFDFFIRSFGDTIGVWETGTLLPRLAGTTAEPQQLAVVFIVPLLLMLSPKRINNNKIAIFLGFITLVLSQSKFAVISILFLFIYQLIVYKSHRLKIFIIMLCLMPFFYSVFSSMDAFAQLLEQGSDAGAIAERLLNYQISYELFKSNWLFGIGIGQYGLEFGKFLFGMPYYNPEYKAANDFLMIVVEMGIIGLFLYLTLFISFISTAFKVLSYKKNPTFLAVYLGNIVIIFNMLIGYELLHTFFWIGVAYILFVIEDTNKNTSAKEIT